MDRTEELRGLVELYRSSSNGTAILPVAGQRSDNDDLNSKLLILAKSIHETLNTNETFISKILRLTNLKEFSNDNTSVITTLSETLQNKINLIEKDINLFKNYVTATGSNNNAGQVQAHYKYILQSLNKIFTEQISQFKTIILNHSSNITNRNKRVTKYSHHESLDSQSIVNNSDNTSKYAMFSAPPTSLAVRVNNNSDNHHMNRISNNNDDNNNNTYSNSTSAHSNVNIVNSNIKSSSTASPHDSTSLSSSGYNELRKRGGAVPISTSSIYSNFNSKNQGVIQEQLYLSGNRNTSKARLRDVNKIESSIARMGHLFSQMSSLVLEQGEALQRIEDDVEGGLVDTEQGYKSMVDYHNITKGNRALILKVFALLVFFVVLFVYLT